MCSSCDVSASAPHWRSRKLIAPVILLAAGVAAAVFALTTPAGRDRLAASMAHQPLSLATYHDVITGRTIKLQRGAALVEVWSSACPACRRQARVLERFARRHPDLQLVAVDVQDSTAQAAAIARSYQWPGAVLLDSRAQLAQRLRLRSFPATLFVKDGRIRAITPGVSRLPTLAGRYSTAISGTAPQSYDS